MLYECYNKLNFNRCIKTILRDCIEQNNHLILYDEYMKN